MEAAETSIEGSARPVRGAGCVRRAQGVVLAVLLVPLATVVALVIGYDQLHRHPEWVARGIEWVAEWPEGSVGLEGWDIRFREARFELRGLRLRPPKARAPTVTLRRAEGDVPPLRPLWFDREVRLGSVIIEGLGIAATHQQPPTPLRTPKTPPWALQADRVQLRGSWYTAPEDAPMKPVDLSSLQGAFRDVRWIPARRWIEGHGEASARLFHVGSIELHDVQLPAMSLTGTDLSFQAATFGYGATTGMAWGTITALDERAAVRIRVMVEGDRVETAVRTATGQTSPVIGALTLNVELTAGGDLPRGAARFSGWARLDDAAFLLGRDLRLIPRLLVDIAPWFERDGQRWLDVGDLQGQASFGRGWVELVRLERPSDRVRPLQAWGSLVDNHVDLVVRVVPRRNREKRLGLGMTVRGYLPDPQIRFAKRDDLRDAPGLITEVRDKKRIRERRREQRQREREQRR